MVHRYDDLRKPWTARVAEEPLRHRSVGGRSGEILKVAWAHLSKAKSRNSEAARQALVSAAAAEKAAMAHNASIETMISVIEGVGKIRKAVEALP